MRRSESAFLCMQLCAVITAATYFANAESITASTSTPQNQSQQTVTEQQAHFRKLSNKFQKAQISGNLNQAHKILTQEIEPFLNQKSSSPLRTEEVLLNLSRIKYSLEERMKSNSGKKKKNTTDKGPLKTKARDKLSH